MENLPLIAFANHVQLGTSAIYKHSSRVLEREVVSRIAGLFISPAALVDGTFHAVCFTISVLYTVGKCIHMRRIDFIVPWQHLQRVRDSVIPILFGSMFGIIHPYLGSCAIEPTKKHIAVGIFLSRTEKENFDAVCSPLTTMSEIKKLFRQLPSTHQLTPQEDKTLTQIMGFERTFEKIQSLDFFNLNLTSLASANLDAYLQRRFGRSGPAEVIKRVAILAYALIACADLTVVVLTSVISLSTIPIKLLGGQAPCYLEAAGSIEVLFYNTIKLPVFAASLAVGVLVSGVDSKAGRTCMRYPMDMLARLPFAITTWGIALRLMLMKEGDTLALPAVDAEVQDECGGQLLPSLNSHMRYLLIEKGADGTFTSELIERGSHHGKTDRYDRMQTRRLIVDVLALRYRFSWWDNYRRSVLSEFKSANKTGDLGQQKKLNNCILTNLFGVIQVLEIKNDVDRFGDMCVMIRFHARNRYRMYKHDFYPWGDPQSIAAEANEHRRLRII